MSARLVVVGGGRMGEALIGGLLAGGWAGPADITVVEKADGRRGELRERFPGLSVAVEPEPCDGAIVAVKPPDVQGACKDIAAAGAGRVLSIAAGVPLRSLEEWLGDGVPVVRAMPNMPALVGAGAAAIAPGSAASAADVAWAAEILGSVGTVVQVGEHLLDAVTGLSGSGPAYVFLVAEALIDAGVLNGLPRPVATELACHTLLGAARLLVETDDTPEALRAAVTTPAGTTAAGLRALEAHGLRAAFLDAVSAATARARELGPPT